MTNSEQRLMAKGRRQILSDYAEEDAALKKREEHRAQRSLEHHQAMAAVARWLHPRARAHTSHSSGFVSITDIAFGWVGSTTALGAVVRKP
jgi:nitrous oxide reductase accessory protein NosL